MEWEFDLLNWMQNHLRSGVMDTVMPVVTFLGNGGWFWIVLTLLGFIPKRTRKYAHVAAIALLLCLICGNLILKPLIARTRPYDIQQIALLVKAPTDYSFPSGHTQASFAVATSIFMWKKRFGIPSFPLLNAMSLWTRIFCGYSIRKDGNAVRQVRDSSVPILFIHGEADDFVPYKMHKKLYKSAGAEKDSYTVENAGHCQSKKTDENGYFEAVSRFVKQYFSVAGERYS